MKTPIASLFSIWLLAASTGSALVPGELGISSDLTYSSAYTFRGIKQAGNSFQPNLEVFHPVEVRAFGTSDLYGGVWGNFPTGGETTELHYYAGLGFTVPGIQFADFDAGVTIYDYPSTGTGRTHEFFLGLHLPLPVYPAWRASLFYYHDVDVRSHVAEGSLTYAYSLERFGLPGALEFSVQGGLQGGSRAATESYRYYGGAVELPLNLSDNSLVIAGVHYQNAEKVNFAPGERGDNLFWSLGFTTFY